MEQPDRKVSKRTIVIGTVRLIVFAVGLLLILALLTCFAAELLHFKEKAVGDVFPQIVVLLVYDAGAMLLLRIALGLSVRWDRASKRQPSIQSRH